MAEENKGQVELEAVYVKIGANHIDFDAGLLHVTKAVDALEERLAKFGKGAASQIKDNLAPAGEAVSDVLSGASISTGPLTDMLKGFTQQITSVLGNFTSTLQSTLTSFGEGLKGVASQPIKINATAEINTAGIDAAKRQVDELRTKLAGFPTESGSSVSDLSAEVIGSLSKLSEGAAKALETMKAKLLYGLLELAPEVKSVLADMLSMPAKPEAVLAMISRIHTLGEEAERLKKVIGEKSGLDISVRQAHKNSPILAAMQEEARLLVEEQAKTAARLRDIAPTATDLFSNLPANAIEAIKRVGPAVAAEILRLKQDVVSAFDDIGVEAATGLRRVSDGVGPIKVPITTEKIGQPTSVVGDLLSSLTAAMVATSILKAPSALEVQQKPPTPEGVSVSITPDFTAFFTEGARVKGELIVLFTGIKVAPEFVLPPTPVITKPLIEASLSQNPVEAPLPTELKEPIEKARKTKPPKQLVDLASSPLRPVLDWSVPLTPTQMADQLNMKMEEVTAELERLIKAGLVKKVFQGFGPGGGAKHSTIELTKQGRAALSAVPVPIGPSPPLDATAQARIDAAMAASRTIDTKSGPAPIKPLLDVHGYPVSPGREDESAMLAYIEQIGVLRAQRASKVPTIPPAAIPISPPPSVAAIEEAYIAHLKELEAIQAPKATAAAAPVSPTLSFASLEASVVAVRDEFGRLLAIMVDFGKVMKTLAVKEPILPVAPPVPPPGLLSSPLLPALTVSASLSPRQIASQLGIALADVRAELDKLISSGHVEMTSPGAKMNKVAGLTQSGKDILSAPSPVVAKAFDFNAPFPKEAVEAALLKARIEAASKPSNLKGPAPIPPLVSPLLPHLQGPDPAILTGLRKLTGLTIEQVKEELQKLLTAIPPLAEQVSRGPGKAPGYLATKVSTPPPPLPIPSAVDLAALKELAVALSALSVIDLSMFNFGIKELATGLKDLGSADLPKLSSELLAFAVAANAAVTGDLAPLSLALRRIGQFMDSARRADLGKITASIPILQNFVSDFVKLSNDMAAIPPAVAPGVAKPTTTMENLDQVTLGLYRIASLVNSMRKIGDLTDFEANSNKVRDVFKDLISNLASVGSPNLEPIATTLQAIGSLIRTFPKMDAAGLAGIATLTTTLKDFITNLNAIGAANLAPISRTFNSLAAILKNIPTFDQAKMSALVTALQGFATALAAIDPNAVLPVARLFSSVVSFLKAVPSLSTNGLIAIADDLVKFANKLAPLSGVAAPTAAFGRSVKSLAAGVSQLSTVNMAAFNTNSAQLIPWLQKLGAVANAQGPAITRLGVAFQRMTQYMKGVSGAPPVLPPMPVASGGASPNISPQIAGTGSAASRSAVLVGGFSDSLRRLYQSTGLASIGIGSLSLSMGGLAGASLKAFASFDDAMIKTLAHMHDWDQTNREILERGVTKVGFESPTSTTELTKGLDILISSGQNAAMATKSLAIAEKFSTASGIEMADATSRLARTQRALGMTSMDVAENYKNMIRLSDLFVGIAPLVGAGTDNVRELSDAFGTKFVAAMRRFGMSLEEGIALQGTFIAAGAKGNEANDMAVRLLHELGDKSIVQSYRWKRLGVDVYEASGKLRPMSGIIHDIDARFSGMSSRQKEATLGMMGFEQRTITAIAPLLDMGKTLGELLAATGDVSGVTAKASEMIRNGFSAQMQILWNRIKMVGVVIGDYLSPAVRAFNSVIGSLIGWFMELNPAIQQFLVIALLTAVALKPLLMMVSLLGTALVSLPIGLVTGAFKVFTGAIGGLASIILMPAKLIYGTISSIVSMVSAGIGSLIGFVGSAIGMIASVGQTIWQPISFGMWLIVKVGKGVAGVMMDIAGSAKSAALAIASFLLKAVLNLGLALASLVLNIVVFAIVGAAVFAFVATAAISLWQIIKSLGGVITNLWQGFKEASSAALNWALGKVDSLSVQILHVWDGAKAGAMDFAAGAEIAINNVAGFFWNFAHNVRAVFAWIGRNWRDLMRDMLDAVFLMVENMLANLKVIGSVLIDLLKTAGPPIMEFLGGIFSDIGRWLSEAFRFAFDNAERYMIGFGKAFVHNFIIVLGVVGELIKEVAGRAARETLLNTRIKLAAGLGGEIPEKQLKYIIRITEEFHRENRKERASILAPLAGMKGAEDFLGPRVARMPLNLLNILKKGLFGESLAPEDLDIENERRRLGGLGPMPEPTGTWKKLTESLGSPEVLGSFKGLSKMVPPLSGFTPRVKENLFPLLNLALPKDPFKSLEEKMLRMFSPQKAEAEDFGSMAGKQGPGFAFKQISLERTMLGGETAESLDYQQLVVLRAIDSKLGRIIAAEGKEPGVLPPRPRPALKD